METETELTEQTARGVVDTVKNLKVVDAGTYELMGNGVQLLRKAKKFFEDRARPRIAEAHEHWKGLLSDLQKDTAPIEAAQKYGDAQLGDYDAEQTRLANLEQLRLQAEQRKRDDEERKQLAALAKKAGEKELAKEILAAPSVAPVVVVHKDVPKIEGISFVQRWDFEITDWSKIPARFHRMEKNPKGEWSCKCMKDLGSEVERLKDTANIPGVRVFKVSGVRGKG
jgi:hypothetical protein